MRSVLGQILYEELGLCAVLSRLQLIGAAFAPVGDDQFVDGKGFGSRHRNQNTRPVKSDCVDGVGYQDFQIAARL